MTGQRPDLTALDLLVRVAECGSLGAAARRIGVAQPNASRAIALLERRLGVVLLDRGPRGSRLTAEGTVVVGWAREALHSVDRIVVGSAALAARQTPHLSVAASFTIAEYLAPRWLSMFRKRRPEVRVSLAVGNSEQVLGMVTSGVAVAGFVESPGRPAAVSSTVIGHDSLVVVVAAAHPWAGRKRPVTALELSRSDLVVREIGSGTRETLARALLRAGTELGVASLELASTAAVKASACSGTGAAVLSRLAVASDLAAGSLVEVPVDGLELSRPLRAVWPTSMAPTRTVSGLIEIATMHVGDL